MFPAPCLRLQNLRHAHEWHDPALPGEITVATSPPAHASLQFIGIIRTPQMQREDCPRQDRLKYGVDAAAVSKGE
ncbi:hypothetical protein ACSQ76_17760 [Roseovarius sp. B08]|uniref:hypothetical protein n=1 Tax=Roseovarius sp. B08 TaxID=3449223 RepID=UPI003EDB81F3